MYHRNLNAVYHAMEELCKNGCVIASYEEIASKALVSRRSVARALNQLEKDSVIKRIHAKGRGITNIYTLTT